MDAPLTTGEPVPIDLRSSGITPTTKAQPPPPPFLLPLNVAFYICLIAHLLAASNAPIQDCDETFNYWEPLHYLTHGSGLQTWEYSPEYRIRSWAYILIHALPIKLASLLGKSRTFEFYFLRCVLATICAGTETRLYSAICRTLNPRIGVFYLMVVAFTPGFFYASTAFLPSSFAMYTSTLGLTAFMDRQGGRKTPAAIMWFGIGALLGWPFAGALVVPFVVDDWARVLYTGDLSNTLRRYINGTLRCLAILALQTGIDAFFYRKITVVPWRLVLYNIFSGEDRGPDIFGTEPWHFYVRNLLLNFNLWFLLSMSALPLLTIQLLLTKQTIASSTTKQSLLRTLTLTTPFYLWFAIFTSQPHKEERFMYPSYPFLALNAAIALHTLTTYLFTTPHPSLLSRIPPKLKLTATLPLLLQPTTIGLLRILGTITAYRAPLQLYEYLPNHSQPPTTTTTTTTTTPDSDSDSPIPLCLAKDWYRLPTSFLLPPHIRPTFITSSFTGLLPSPFHETLNSSIIPPTHILPIGMNDRNLANPSQHVDVNSCSFLVDSYFPSVTPSNLEPDYISDTDNWEVIVCLPFLDNAATGVMGRMVWVPGGNWVPERFRRVWGGHCLLRARRDEGT